MLHPVVRMMWLSVGRLTLHPVVKVYSHTGDQAEALYRIRAAFQEDDAASSRQEDDVTSSR